MFAYVWLITEFTLQSWNGTETAWATSTENIYFGTVCIKRCLLLTQTDFMGERGESWKWVTEGGREEEKGKKVIEEAGKKGKGERKRRRGGKGFHENIRRGSNDYGLNRK